MAHCSKVSVTALICTVTSNFNGSFLNSAFSNFGSVCYNYVQMLGILHIFSCYSFLESIGYYFDFARDQESGNEHLPLHMPSMKTGKVLFVS